ncbi:Zinc finger and SCAN domain-containing protein 20 [Chelonia mydas]|uniref:Zinc finger and SCAN domain-containing protein 20 n=1 Tax=Chelonia mydas TaxID=8469 RepID=M7APN0_CHEMY|nr:Zinc finger and SCAN domain-containing protein 20 [Chelonia mydas]
MVDPRRKRSPAWTTAELLDLISVCGEEFVQSQLRSSCGNFDIEGQITHSLHKKGYDRYMLQCRAKVKELRNAYHKAKGANRCSGAAPQTCHFYKELDAIQGGDHTSNAKSTVDTSVGLEPVESGPNPEEKVIDEEWRCNNAGSGRTQLRVPIQDKLLKPKAGVFPPLRQTKPDRQRGLWFYPTG